MKKVLSFLLVLLCLLALVSCEISVFDNGFSNTSNFTYDREPDGESYAIASGALSGILENRGNVVIPAGYKPSSKERVLIKMSIFTIGRSSKGDPVTRIANRGFQQEEGITSLTIPASIKIIGYYAFADCTSLTTIKFEGTVEQWNAIAKGTGWNDNVPATEVICSDGVVSLK